MASEAVALPMQLRRLLPLKHQLSGLESEVVEARGALEVVLNSDETMALMGLSIRAKSGGKVDVARHEAVETILVAYRRALNGLLYQIKQAHEEVDNTQELLAMSLDSHRNSILQLNMRVSIATLALTGMAVPAGILGMNLTNGLEDIQGAFWVVTGSLYLLGGGAWLALGLWLERGLKSEGRKHADQLAALRRIISPQLQRDLERVLRKMQHAKPTVKFSRDSLRDAFAAMPGRPPLSEEDLDIIFHYIDQDLTGDIDYREYIEILKHQPKPRHRPNY
uniref:EF-hand domain-containing protein n=1 Tax=Hemiselmis andersenii TaxID=464988 RepID=A0A7S1ECP4_HEMAN